MRTSSGWLTGIAAATLASGAVAQDAAPRRVAVGQAIEGRFGRVEVRHDLTLNAGQTVRIDARSRDFDPLIKLYGPTGVEPLAMDDDSGGGTAAQLIFTAAQAGVYRIGVSRSGAADTPSAPTSQRSPADPAPPQEAATDLAYDLTVLAAATPRPPVQIAPNGGQPIMVDMSQCSTGCRFTLGLNKGDRLIAYTSKDNTDTDPILALYLGSQLIVEDDDGGGGVNARIVRHIDAPGTYTLLARTTSQRGKFTLLVSAKPDVPRALSRLTLGTTTGTITPDSEIASNGKSYNAYLIHGEAGQRMAIDLESTAFDPQIDVYGRTIVGPVLAASNDDSDTDANGRPVTNNRNSRLILTFVEAGDLEVRAVSLGDGGAYTLRLGNQPPP